MITLWVLVANHFVSVSRKTTLLASVWAANLTWLISASVD